MANVPKISVANLRKMVAAGMSISEIVKASGKPKNVINAYIKAAKIKTAEETAVQNWLERKIISGSFKFAKTQNKSGESLPRTRENIENSSDYFCVGIVRKHKKEPPIYIGTCADLVEVGIPVARRAYFGQQFPDLARELTLTGTIASVRLDL